MDTPEKTKNNQIATSLTRFEDSPVFRFLNGLSPIKPLKSVPFTQTTNPLTYASLQSVFASPHATSLKECRFLPRPQISDPWRPEFCTDDWNTVNENKTKLDDDDDHKENIDPTPSNNGEVLSNEPSYGECSELIGELLRNLETSEGNLEGVGGFDPNKGSASSSDWGSLSSILPESYSSAVDPATSFYTSIKQAMQNTTRSRNVFGQPEEEGEMMMMMENNETLIGMNSGSSIPNPCENNIDYQPESIYGVRRRCLVFNKDGARAKYSTSGSCIPENDPSRVLPAVGLHLNALTATPRDYNNANIDSSISRRPLMSSALFTSQQLTNIPLQREIDSVVRVEDSCWESGYMESEDNNNNPSSPKKKRRRESDGSCKRCNCKKSKCLKLYCECFAAGVYCTGPCACVDCFNKPAHEDIVLSTRKQIVSRNPLAFAPKVIRGSASISEIGDDHFSKTPASARHKRGCNCKKSGCLKKYCECYQSGVGCSVNCRCEGCKNAFGAKDNIGSGAVRMEHEYEEEEEEDETNAAAVKADQLNRSFRKTTIQDEGFGMPEFLLECSSSRGGTQLPSSPNGKRVSPPKSCGVERSPAGGRRMSSRKLILQPLSLERNR